MFFQGFREKNHDFVFFSFGMGFLFFQDAAAAEIVYTGIFIIRSNEKQRMSLKTWVDC